MNPLELNLQETNLNVAGITQELDNLLFKNDCSTKMCTHFAKYGNCRYDKNCKFLHHQKQSAERELFHHKVSTARISKAKSPRNDCGVFKKVFDREKQPGFRYVSSFHQKDTSQKPCKYFLAGRCSKENCNFKHTPKHSFASSSSANSTLPSKNKKKSIPLCHYFKRGACLKGDDCKYFHSNKTTLQNENVEPLVIEKNDLDESVPEASNLIEISHAEKNIVIPDSKGTHVNQLSNICSDKLTTDCEIPCLIQKEESASKDHSTDVSNSKEDNVDQPSSISSNVFSKAYTTPCQVLKIFDFPLPKEEIILLRETEIAQLKKRYPGCTESQANAIFSFEFTPTDPDWVHNVAAFCLQITFPDKYPVEACEIKVLQSADFILETILRHLNKCISDWLHERHKQLMEMKKVELLFRPFLRWFDKNLSNMLSFCFQKDTESSRKANVLCEENDTEDINLVKLPPTVLESHTPSSGSTKTQTISAYKAQKYGFSVSLTGLELVEGVGTLSCTKLDLTLLCKRCKTSAHVTTTPKKNKAVTCSKCSLVMQCNYEPSIIHQFTNVLGTVYLVGCTGLDVNLVECAFLVDCLNCSKQVPIAGLHPGSKQKFWCVLCNQKFLLSIQSSKFQASGVSYTSIKAEPVKKIERKKDAQIKEGGPLPEFGICKHYKKSNRWFRFPCCGRVYPCDVCHDEKEDGHEIKFASRIICGFCSKEQPFTKDKPCSGCSAQVTAKSASHWEGGKGCRNKILMSRGDKKKYTGISKTVPKNSLVSSSKKK